MVGLALSRNHGTTPRGVAVSGIIFSILISISLVLIRMAVPANPADTGDWIFDDHLNNLIHIGLTLVPFAGIAFLWFMASLRSRIGILEDQFFSTVFLGSGLLFVALLFIAAAVSSSTLENVSQGRISPHGETYAFARRVSFNLINILAIKVAAVFMFVTSSIGLRTAFLSRWLAFMGFVFGVILLVVIAKFSWIILLFPFWTFVLSIYLLLTESRTSWCNWGQERPRS